jgi:hypothetical protein
MVLGGISIAGHASWLAPSLSNHLQAHSHHESGKSFVPADTGGQADPAFAARCIDTFTAQFPVVRKMLDHKTFASVAAGAARHCSQLADMTKCGAFVPKYLRRLGHSPSIEYLADIAELELAYWKAGPTAATANSVPAFSKVYARLFDQLSVEFNPSVSVMRSRFPIVTIWENYRCWDDRFLPKWGPEAALVFNRSGLAQIRRLSAGEYAFVSALSHGATLGKAITRAKAASLDVDLVANNPMLLIDCGIVSGFRDRLTARRSMMSPNGECSQ